MAFDSRGSSHRTFAARNGSASSVTRASNSYDMAPPPAAPKEDDLDIIPEQPQTSSSRSTQRDDGPFEKSDPARDVGGARKVGSKLKFWKKFEEGQKRYVRRKVCLVSINAYIFGLIAMILVWAQSDVSSSPVHLSGCPVPYRMKHNPQNG